MSQRYFEDPEHAKLYAKHRASPPTELISRVIGYLKEKIVEEDLHLAVDVGCGSGQNTNLIAPYFKRVVGSDISEAQIIEAKNKTDKPNVDFVVSPAELLPFENDSVHLLTSCVACHWFDLPNFYKEVARLVKTNGIVAFYCYTFPSIVADKNQDKLNEAMKDVVHGSLGKYWGDGIRHIQNRYTEITIPCAETVVREFYDEVFEKNLSEVIAGLTTFSAYQTMRKVEGVDAAENMLKTFENRVRDIVGADEGGSESIRIKVMEHWSLVMGRKE